ncbi:PAS domain-containing sensor histidine kinase [Halorubrum ezzemoulense]|uniref:two-component system sensor histidine kinase NtrB n=1 Tax=Halorubrum ezzemoulense TaxID=337243 RepID=UPI00232BED91|nr:PAS domain-containing sensor histidine kinase [Halorubrum ezzemoulense]MDB9285334.1 PAS domain-containing sensor histidine kinase [Halorubrum ezzemoulense]
MTDDPDPATNALDPPTNASESGDPVARRLLEGVSTHAIFMLNADGNIIAWPAPAMALYGHDATAVLDRHVRMLFADDEGEADSDSLLGDFFAEPREESVEFEHWHRRADGSVFWGTLTLSPLRNGEFHGYAAISRDTTTAKEYERMLERQNDRLKEFTDILAHDLRNPLNVIEGSLTLYEEAGDEEHLERIGETTNRMARLVDDLLRVARQGNVVSDPEPTDVGEVVEAAWRSLGGKSGATLTYDPVPSVSSDSDRLRELFENLFQNAMDHGGDDAAVRVGPLDTGFFIEDDGPGIADGCEEEVFDHGFTTRDGGHGYGLSVVRTIVNAHGWDVVATEAESGGARFEITGIDFLG